jgi:non-heme chloroperoxidase
MQLETTMTNLNTLTPPSTATITDHEMQQVERANVTGFQPVVFVHGLWLLPSSWDRWAALFEEAGFVSLTPGWPDDPETVAEANAKPEVFAHKTVGQVADHFDHLLRGLKSKPAIIGHSFGGLLAQILAGRGLSAATVAIDPAPFRGVLPLPLSALKSAWPVLGNPANRNRAIPLTYDQFRYGFANAVSEDEAKELYATFAVPASTAAHRFGREGSHGAVGHRQRVVQAAAGQSGRDRDRGNAKPWSRADDRQRMAGGCQEGARIC